MVYLGSGRRDVQETQSGLRYFVSERRRHFRADPMDVEQLLQKREFMLKV